MNMRTRNVAVFVLTAIALGAGCKQRRSSTSIVQEANPQPKRHISQEQISALPKSILGYPSPIGKAPGLNIGATLSSGLNFNEAAAKQMEARVRNLFLQQLSKGGPIFSATVAVSIKNLYSGSSIGVRMKVKRDSGKSAESLYGEMSQQDELKRYAGGTIVQDNLQAVVDTKSDFFEVFGIAERSDSEAATAPLSVAVVAMNGDVYGPFDVSGRPGDQTDLVFRVLGKLLAQSAAAH